MDEVTKSEIERIHDENTRQNHRIDNLEKKMATLETINLSIKELALNMKAMLEEQTKQGSRLEKLEQKPGEAWETMQKTVLTTIVSAIAGGLAVALFQLISANVK